MYSATLIDKSGNRIAGKLYTDGVAERIPATLATAMGVGTFTVGRIECSLGHMAALFTIETVANEVNLDERRAHELWIQSHHMKPGDVIGKAVDKEGKLYAFQSA